eukprot:93858-Pelagomonas_calceolata.AAC.1
MGGPLGIEVDCMMGWFVVMAMALRSLEKKSTLILLVSLAVRSLAGSLAGRPGGDQEDPQGAGQPSTASGDSNNVWNQLPPELRAAPPGSCSPAVEVRAQSGMFVSNMFG